METQNKMETELDAFWVSYWVENAKKGKGLFSTLTKEQLQLIKDYIECEIDNWMENNWDYEIDCFEGINVDFTEYDEDYEEGDDTINLSGEDYIKIKYDNDFVKAFDDELKEFLMNNWKEHIRSIEGDEDDPIIIWLENNWDDARSSLACYIDNTTTEDIITSLGYELIDEPMLK